MTEPAEPTQAPGWLGALLAAQRQVDDRLHPDQLHRSTEHWAGVAEQVEGDLVEVLRPLLAQFADNDELHPDVRQAFSVLTAPEHFSQLAVAFAGVYALVRTLVDAAITPYAQSVLNASYSHHQSMPLSAAELAIAVVKQKVGLDFAHGKANQIGLSDNAFDILVNVTGEPIAIEQALLLYRRGQIDDAQLLEIVAESRVRTHYIEQIKDLRYAPPPAGEVVMARVKERISDEHYHRGLREAGIDPVNAPWMLLAAGRPYGTHEALDLLNRREIDESRVRQVIAQSDINTDFTDDILKLRFYIPPPRSVLAMLRAGAITEARARELFSENGVRPVDVEAFIDETHKTKTAQTRDLSAAQVVRMYEAQLMTVDQVTARLTALGFDAHEAGLLIELADAQRHERLVSAVIARVRSRYVAHKIDRTTAHSALLADGVTVEAAASLLHLWDIERGISQHVVSTAAIVGAYRRGAIDAVETHDRLLAAGVDPDDLIIVVADGFPPNKVPIALVMAVVTRTNPPPPPAPAPVPIPTP